MFKDAEDYFWLFKKYYNAKYLQFIPFPFFQNATWIRNKYRDLNDVQRQLFENCFKTPTYLRYSFIEGPSGCNIIETKTETKQFDLYKTFYIFSEVHNQRPDGTVINVNGTCEREGKVGPESNEVIHIKDYLRMLAAETTQFLDVFVEMPESSENREKNEFQFIPKDLFDDLFGGFVIGLVNKKKNMDASIMNMIKNYDLAYVQESNLTLNAVRQEFVDCLHSETRFFNSKCNLVRLHYIDIRKTIDYSDRRSLRFRLNFLEDLADFLNSIAFDPFKQELLKSFNLETKTFQLKRSFWLLVLKAFKIMEFVRQNLEGDFVNSVKILNNYIENIPDKLKNIIFSSPLAQNIINHVAKAGYIRYFSSININSLWETLLHSENEEAYNIAFDSFIKFIHDLNVALVDCYCLASIFRKFPVVSPLEVAPNIASTVVIYAGTAHSQLYHSFIDLLGVLHFKIVLNAKFGETVYDVEEKVETAPRCLNLPSEYQINNTIDLRTGVVHKRQVLEKKMFEKPRVTGRRPQTSRHRK
jgi:hypothetical protein